MTDDPDEVDFDEAALRLRLAVLKKEHAEIDAEVREIEQAVAPPDQLRIMRLKRRKLQLRDEIVLIEDRLTPDIIA